MAWPGRFRGHKLGYTSSGQGRHYLGEIHAWRHEREERYEGREDTGEDTGGGEDTLTLVLGRQTCHWLWHMYQLSLVRLLGLCSITVGVRESAQVRRLLSSSSAPSSERRQGGMQCSTV